MKTFLVCVFMAVVLTWIAVLERSMLRRKRNRFQARSDLSRDDLHKLFAGTGLDFHELDDFLVTVSRASEMPMVRLRPSDRFDTDLAPAKGWEFDDGVALLPLALQRRFGGCPADYDLTKNATLSGLLDAVDRVVSGHRMQHTSESDSVAAKVPYMDK
jgi:hypothetical protein